MRFLTLLLALVFMSGCAHQGVIVQKESRPHPLYHSIGIEGAYAFLLRDNAGVVHRQMVTPEVFEQYTEGDYFNDLQPASPRGDSDGKAVRTAMRPVVSSTSTLASRSKPTNARQLAAKPKMASKSVAKLPTSAAKKTNQQVRRSSTSSRNITVAAVGKKKSVARKSVPVTEPTLAPATPKASNAPEVMAPTMKSAPASPPTLPVTKGETSDEPEIVYIPPRVR